MLAVEAISTTGLDSVRSTGDKGIKGSSMPPQTAFALVISLKDLYPLNVRLGGPSIASHLVLHLYPWTIHYRTTDLDLPYTRSVHNGFNAREAASLIWHFYTIQTQSFRYACT
jgi:hypothetical protein